MTTQLTAGFTHGGKFHADDVFSAALLRIVSPEIAIQRGYDVPENFDGIVFDIGGGAYDHHGPNAPVRENGVPYAAFGLLWKKFGPALVGEEEAAYFDKSFIEELDLDDNTGSGSSLAAAIGSFNPGWDSADDPDARFELAVTFARQILDNRIALIRGDGRAKELVEAAFAKMEDGIAILPQFVPWKRAAKRNRAVQFVVYPSQRGGYAAQAANDPGSETHAMKCPFPAAWAGLRDADAARVSGIKTLRFCHNSRFMITAGTQQDAISACYAAKRQAPVRLIPAAGFAARAIVTDCDGTIVDEGMFEPTDAVLYEYEKAHQRGATIIVASGRILPVIPKRLRGVADYYVCGSGALAADKNGKTLFKDAWSRADVEELSAFCDATGGAVSFFFEESYGVYAGYEKFAAFYGAHLGCTDCIEQNYDKIRHLTQAPYGAFYIGTDAAMQQYLAAHPDLQAAAFMSGYYDVYKKATNKARMIGRVLKLAQVGWDETAAFGDGGNDVEMLRHAGLGYAMENARDPAKEAADIIAPSVEQDGEAKALRALREYEEKITQSQQSQR